MSNSSTSLNLNFLDAKTDTALRKAMFNSHCVNGYLDSEDNIYLFEGFGTELSFEQKEEIALNLSKYVKEKQVEYEAVNCPDSGKWTIRISPINP